MRPTQVLRSGEAPPGKYGLFIGHNWGALGSKPQRGIITFGLAANRQNPFAGAFHDAIFNTWRRFSSQVLYIAPPLLVGYYAMNWAIERNHYLNSKAGLAEFGDAEE